MIVAQRQEIAEKAKEEERLRKKLSGGSSCVEKVEQCRGEGEGDEVQEGGRHKAKIQHTATKRAPFRVAAELSKSAADQPVPTQSKEDVSYMSISLMLHTLMVHSLTAAVTSGGGGCTSDY